MGAHSHHGEAMDWPEYVEKYFLEILAERHTRDPNGAPVFKGTDWIEMDEVIFLKFGLRYGHDKLKGKYHRMRMVHTKFGELIGNTDVTWDANSGQFFANDTVWNDFYKRDKIFKTFKKKGCKHYQLLGSVFNNSTATGAFHYASTSDPQTSEEEQRVDQDCLGVSADNDSGRGKRNLEADLECLPDNRRVKRNSGNDEYDSLLDAWRLLFAAKIESYLAKDETYKSKSNEATSSMAKEFSIKDCMDVLNSMDDVSTSSYNKAIEFFVDPSWRKIFLLMSEHRRKGWVNR